MTLPVEDCNLVQYCYVHPGVGVGVGMPYGVDAYVDIDVYYTDVDADNDVFVLKSKGHWLSEPVSIKLFQLGPVTQKMVRNHVIFLLFWLIITHLLAQASNVLNLDP